MTVTNVDEWVADGSPWRAAPAVAMFAEMMRGYGFTVYVIGDRAHLTADPPEDHTPYSHTAWPAGQPYPCVLALDVMPGGRVDWRRLGEVIATSKAMNRPGTEWIKYINYTLTDGQCRHVSWEPAPASRPSTDTGHIHISARSDLFTQTDFVGWDPVADMLAGAVNFPVSTPAPAGANTTEDIVNQLPLLQAGGAKGQTVRNLQALLNAHASYGLVIDGDFGPLTDAAARSFQVAHHVLNSVTASGHGDGKVGAHTWAALLDVS
jgi:hypothetical protein